MPKTTDQPTPAASQRPRGITSPDPNLREISKALALKIARFFGFTDYRAEVAERLIPVVIMGDLSTATEEDATRTGADYKVFQVDLAVARPDPRPIEGSQDMVMTNVAVIALTAGATFRLHVGERQGILFGGAGLGLGAGFEAKPAEQTRLSVTNAAQPGATAEILVSAGVRVTV